MLTRLEHLFYLHHNNMISDYIAEQELYKLQQESADKLSKVNKLIRYISDKQRQKNKKEAEQYIEKVYYNIYKKQT